MASLVLGPEPALLEICQVEAAENIGSVAGDHDDTPGPADANVFGGQRGAITVDHVEADDTAEGFVRERDRAIARGELEPDGSGNDVGRASARAADRQHRGSGGKLIDDRREQRGEARRVGDGAAVDGHLRRNQSQVFRRPSSSGTTGR